MPSEALQVVVFDIHSASSGIDGGTGCNFFSHRRFIMGITENSNTILRESWAQFLIVLEEHINEIFR